MPEPACEPELEVLLIEDNPADAQLVQALLAGADGIVVDRAATLEAALAELRARPFDAVLLDLLLPDARGVDLVGSIAAAAPASAVVVVSGGAGDDGLLAQAVLRKGAEALLPKGELTAALLARTVIVAVEQARRRTVAGRREALLAEALRQARIGHWSWSPGSPVVQLVGLFPGLERCLPDGGQRLVELPLRQLLRRLPSWLKNSLFVAWRELASGPDRLAIIAVESRAVQAGPGQAGPGQAGPGQAGAGHDAAEQNEAGQDGRIGDLLLEVVVERDRLGKISRLLGIVRDGAEAALVERLEGDMLTHLGHELRTPLTSIRGALGLLAEGAEAPPTGVAQTLVDQAIANAERIARVIDEALQSAAEPPSGLLFQPRRLPLGACLHDALVARLPTLTAAGITLGLAAEARAMAQLVEVGRLRRAVDCLCHRLLAKAEHRGRAASGLCRLTLDVVAHGEVAWLRTTTVPAQASSNSGVPGANAGRRAAAQHADGARPWSRAAAGAPGSGPASDAGSDWRIAVPLAA